MDWFEELFGFAETSPEDVRSGIDVQGNCLVSRINGRKARFGRLEIASLAELEDRLPGSDGVKRLTLSSIIADVSELHADPQNAGALFQAASQFNLLEMASPMISPESGVGIYGSDHTQGPACAIACGAGTVYRNYFVPIRDQLGQTEETQIDCLSEIGASIQNDVHGYWRLQNGYAFAEAEGLIALNERLKFMSASEVEALIRSLRIGVQWHADVTLGSSQHRVTQAYCSALPIGYSTVNASHWKPFASLILKSSYRATLAAAVLNAAETSNRTVFLTLVGGGVFNNPPECIADAIVEACQLYSAYDLDVKIVSFSSHLETEQVIRRWERVRSD